MMESFRYQSSNAEIATVDQNGLVTAITDGDVFIAALNQGVSSTTPIFVRSETVTTTVEGFVLQDNAIPLPNATVNSSKSELSMGPRTIAYVPSGAISY